MDRAWHLEFEFHPSSLVCLVYFFFFFFGSHEKRPLYLHKVYGKTLKIIMIVSEPRKSDSLRLISDVRQKLFEWITWPCDTHMDETTSSRDGVFELLELVEFVTRSRAASDIFGAARFSRC